MSQIQKYFIRDQSLAAADENVYARSLKRKNSALNEVPTAITDKQRKIDDISDKEISKLTKNVQLEQILVSTDTDLPTVETPNSSQNVQCTSLDCDKITPERQLIEKVENRNLL